jgi:hypothetical protein
VGVAVELDPEPHTGPPDHNAIVRGHHAPAKSQIGQALVVTGINTLQGDTLGFCEAHKILAFWFTAGRVAGLGIILVQQINLSTP